MDNVMRRMRMGKESYETQLMGLSVKSVPEKQIYFCTKCKQVVIRHRNPASKTYMRWCCGDKMIRIRNKCHICGMNIKGSNHFQGKHHLAKVAEAKATRATEIKFGM
jgi:hypothetical protein